MSEEHKQQKDREVELTEEDRKEIIEDFFQDLADKQRPPDPEVEKLISDNFWDLV